MLLPIHQSLCHVVSSPSFADTSIVVAYSLDPSSLAYASVIIVNSLILLLRRQCLLCCCGSLRSVVSSSSPANKYFDVVNSLGSSSSAATSVVVVDSLGPPSRRCRLRHRCQFLKRVVSSSSSTDASVVVVNPLGPSSSAYASIAVVNSLGQSSHLRRLCHQRQSLGRVVYFSFSTNASIIIVNSSGPSPSAYASVIVINSSGLSSSRRCLCCCYQSFGCIVSSSSLADTSVAVVNSYGPSSSA